MNALFRRLRPARRPVAAMRVQSASRSHVGRVRAVNEDRVLDRADLGIWAVADGMGGHSGGALAAETLVAKLDSIDDAAAPDAIDAALAAANTEILAQGGGESGTTVVLFRLTHAAATLHWAGDSRAYRIRGGSLHPLTRDHSVVQQMVDAGALTPEQAAHHPRANVITNAVGIAETLSVEQVAVTVQLGDRLLLCSDGLSRSLCDRDVARDEGVEEMADRLLTNALQRDGSDNISLVLIAFD